MWWANPTVTHTEHTIAFFKTYAKTISGDESRWKDRINGLPFGQQSEAQNVTDLIVFFASDCALHLSETVMDTNISTFYL